MGANQSYDGEITPESLKGAQHSKHYKHEQLSKTGGDKLLRCAADAGGKKLKANPCPPHKPKILEATHNSITLSWQPPRYNHHNPSNCATVIAYTVEMARFSAGNSKSHGHGGKLHQGQWTTLTKVCQSTSYTARDLDPDTAYAFRVRAENVFGVGKPSVPSEITTTHMFESTISDSLSLNSQTFGSPKSGSPIDRHFHRPSSPASPSPPDFGEYPRAAPRLRRRHSFNVHLDGGAVTKIVNHSDVVLTNPEDPQPPSVMSHSHSCHDSLLSPGPTSPPSLSSSSTLSRSSSLMSGFSPRHRYSDRRRGACANSDDRSPRLYERANNASHPSASLSSLCRKNSYTNNRNNPSSHTSSQGRKISLPILLPGTGTNSLSRLKESRSSLRSSVPDIQVGRGQGASGSHEVMVITVGPNNNSRSCRRSSNGSLGSHNRYSNKDRHSRSSSGSGGSEVTSSRMSLEDSTSSELSRRARTSTASSASSGAVEGQAILDGEGGSRCGSFPNLSQRSSRSDVTLSNSKDGSKDSLCDLASSNHSSMGDGNGDDLADDNPSVKVGNNKQDCEKLYSFNNNNNIKNNNNSTNVKNGLVNIANQVDFENCDDIYKLKEELRNFEITEEKLRFHDLGQSLNFQKNLSHHTQQDLNGVLEKGSYYANLENPWERDPSASGLSERILAAPFCDDIKMALYARDLPDTSAIGIPSPGTLTECDEAQNHTVTLRNNNSHHHQSHGVSSAVYGDAGDFRTLRSVLQSNSMFVKAQRFSSDVVGVVVEEGGDTCRTLTRARLTTIADADEDEDAVRITAL